MAVTYGNRQVLPTSTVSLARLVVYQPTQRPKTRVGEWQVNAWGRCLVTGRLGQRHADLMDAFLACAERKRVLEDGGVELLVDPAHVRKTLSDKRHSLGRIKNWIVELRAAVIQIETPHLSKTGAVVVGGILDHLEPSPMTRPNPLGGVRHLWRVRLGKAYIRLLENDLGLYYDPAPIARLSCGISQAIARHILTHKIQPTGGWHLDSLITAVGGAQPGDRVALENRRREIRADTAGLAKIGIAIEGSRIRRNKEDVCSSGPVASSNGLKASSRGLAAVVPAQGVQDFQEIQPRGNPLGGDSPCKENSSSLDSETRDTPPPAAALEENRG